MNGVDIANQVRAVYETYQKTQRLYSIGALPRLYD